jgi:hypothetical protein
VTLDGFEGYGVVPGDSRFVYFAMQDVYDLLVGEAGELNLFLMFNMCQHRLKIDPFPTGEI